MKISITKNENPAVKPADGELSFGKYFSDHMFMMDYTEGKGWENARIVPFGPMPMHPSSTVFHYGAEIFEGLKAYRTKSGSIQLFRPDENAHRLNVSAQRLCLPLVDEADFIQALLALVDIDREWVPHSSGTSLYLRPFLFGNDESLGVHAVKHARFMIIASPVGSYYKEGINPVKIMIEHNDVRAVKGGTGFTKCGGNYAASVRAGAEAEEKGYSQVLWLDGVERKYIEEVGAMNVMFKFGDTVVTPALNGSILSGITRKSCLEILRQKGYKVEERLISIDELIDACKDGTLVEAWGTGTAAAISPIGEFCFDGEKYAVNGGKIGDTAQMLYDTLVGLQWGEIEDEQNWIVEVK